MTGQTSASLDALTTNPHHLFHALRSSGSVVWIDAIDGWVVLSHEAASRVMRDPVSFTVDDPRFTTALVIGPSMLSLDGPEHRRQRRPFLAGMRAGSRVTPSEVRKSAHRILARVHSLGSAEMREAFAGPLATRTTLDVLGLETAPSQARRWYTHIVEAVTEASAGNSLPYRGRAAFSDLGEAVAAALGDPSTLVAKAAAELTFGEVAANAAVVMFGGIETGEGAISNLLWHVYSSDTTIGMIANDPSLVPAAIEESLRLEPAASRVDRYATVDIDLDGASIKAGDLVIVSLAAANRDPGVFPDPDTFDLHRPNRSEHLAFAVGPHACPGANLARLEAATALEAIFDALPGARLDGEHSDAPSGLVFRKPNRVTLTWPAKQGE